MRSRFTAAALALAGLAAPLLSSCAEFDREDRINDLRVLGVRTEPAELLYHPFHGFIAASERPPFLTLPTTNMTVDVLAFDPRGGRLVGDVSLCPEGRGVCNNFDLDALLLNEPEDTRGEVRDAWRPREFDFPLSGSDPEEPGGRVPVPSFNLNVTPAVMDSFIPDSVDPTTGERFPLISFFPTTPRLIVDVSNSLVPEAIGVTREVAFKRIPIGIDLGHPDLPPEFKDALGQALGIDVCDEVIPRELFEEGITECYEPRPPNKNPALLGFDLDDPAELEALDDEGMRYATVADVGTRSLLSAAPGNVIALTPVFKQDDVEGYQIIKFDIDSQTIFLENRYEDYAASWFTTAGDVSDSQTDLQFAGRMGVTWRLPQRRDPGDRDQLMMVVVDQRGGTSWATVTVEYR